MQRLVPADYAADLYRLIVKRWDELGLTLHGYRRLTGAGSHLSSTDIHALREGNLNRQVSFVRAVDLAESLGLQVYVSVLEGPPPRTPSAKPSGRPATR